MTTPRTTRDQDLVDAGRRAIATERQGLAAIEARIDAAFAAACRVALACRGRIVVTGMGKSGHVGG
ncbi:MAG: D-arabinose 5-phosphate isomerase, partial [Gammaproteobacteria bacterium]